MTDDQHHSDPPELTPQEDALVSAVLDGEADDEQRRLVDADPRLRERVALLERVGADLRVVPPPTDDERDRAVHAALAAAPNAAAPVTSIDHARRTRWRRALGVAAAVAALVVAVPVVALTVSRGSETDSSTSADLAAPAAGQAESGAAATSLPPVDTASIVDLGAVDTDEQLRAAVDTALADRALAAAADEESKPTTAPLEAFAARAASECATTESTTDAALGAAVLVATATWQGEPALVTVHGGAPPVIVVQRDDCTVIARIDD